MNDLPPLVADGGELRLARRVASYVYGRREVTWPEDVDDPEDNLPDEREFGWVAKLPGPEPGLSERRFVRGDVQIDAVENVSNVEELLDESASRAGGDVFFESMIEGRGLGRLKPGVDFDEGDLVDVRFWGRVLPDQLVTSIEWHDGVPSVKIGGQLTSDTSELARARAETIRLITQERKERAGDVAEARSMAVSAQSTADTARSEAKELRDTLGGAGASPESLLSQLASINAQIVGMGGAEQPGLLSMYLAMNTRLWEFQQQWNREREEIDTRQDAQAELLQSAFDEARAASQNAQAAMARDMTRMLFADREQQVWDTFLQVKMPRFNRTVVVEQRGSWSGTVMLQLQYSNGAFYQRGRTLSGGQVWTETIPLGDVTNAIVFYQVQTGSGYGSGESDN